MIGTDANTGKALAGVTCSLADVQALVDSADVTDEPPFDAMARLGLELQQPVEEIA